MMDAGGIRLFVGDGVWFVETTITEAFENSKDASNRLNELIEFFGLCQDEEVE